MTDAQWESLSNQSVAACGVLYFLALLAYLVQWSALRRVAAPLESKAAADSTNEDRGAVAVAVTSHQPPDNGATAALMGRLGLVLTIFATAIHGLALVARDLRRIPTGCRGETCTSSPWPARSSSRSSSWFPTVGCPWPGWLRWSSASC